MSEPVLFVSHFRIKEGGSDIVSRAARDAASQINSDKPHTVLYLIYLDPKTDKISFLHAFRDADAMDVHFVGADERFATIREYVEPLGWEVYGSPSPPALDVLRQRAAASGSALSVSPDYVAGFLRQMPVT